MAITEIRSPGPLQAVEFPIDGAEVRLEKDCSIYRVVVRGLGGASLRDGFCLRRCHLYALRDSIDLLLMEGE